jgi:hypothetical protein
MQSQKAISIKSTIFTLQILFSSFYENAFLTYFQLKLSSHSTYGQIHNNLAS